MKTMPEEPNDEKPKEPKEIPPGFMTGERLNSILYDYFRLVYYEGMSPKDARKYVLSHHPDALPILTIMHVEEESSPNPPSSPLKRRPSAAPSSAPHGAPQGRGATGAPLAGGAEGLSLVPVVLFIAALGLGALVVIVKMVEFYLRGCYTWG